MLDFGWAELLIIVAVAVFVIGPKDIPNVMYGVGRLVRRFQYMKFAMSKQFDDMMQMHDVDELRRGVNFEDRSNSQTSQEIESDADQDIDPSMDIDEAHKTTKAHYTQIADQYNQTFTDPSDYIDQFLERLDDGAKILDVGCGTGNNTSYLAGKGYDVTAIDFSDDMLMHARHNYPDLEFLKMDMRALNFDDGFYDALISAYSIIHLKKTELLSVLEIFYTVLKSEGHLYLAFHSGASEERVETEPFNTDLQFFLNILEESEIKNLLNLVGFDVLEILENKSSFDEELPFNKVTIIAKKGSAS